MRVALLLYVILFSIIAGNLKNLLPLLPSSETEWVMNVLANISIVNLVLLFLGIIYDLFCLIKKYFIDMIVTVIMQVLLFIYSTGILVAYSITSG